MMQKIKSKKTKWYFLAVVIFVYIIAAVWRSDIFFQALRFSLDIFSKLVPAFIFVFAIMVASNYFLTTSRVIKHVGARAGWRKWVYVIAAGIVASGPIYLWYPVLKDLKDKGMEDGLVATFLYNRAIKFSFIPLMIVYFDWPFIITLTILMIVASVIQGIAINKLMDKRV